MARLLEHPGNRVELTKMTTSSFENLPNLCNGSVTIVRGCLHKQRNATGAIALVVDLFINDPGKLARSPLDGTLDVVSRHVLGFCSCDRSAQPWIRFAVRTSLFGSDCDLLNQSREHLATGSVGSALLPLDRAPLGMTGHQNLLDNENPIIVLEDPPE